MVKTVALPDGRITTMLWLHVRHRQGMREGHRHMLSRARVVVRFKDGEGAKSSLISQRIEK